MRCSFSEAAAGKFTTYGIEVGVLDGNSSKSIRYVNRLELPKIHNIVQSIFYGFSMFQWFKCLPHGNYWGCGLCCLLLIYWACWWLLSVLLTHWSYCSLALSHRSIPSCNHKRLPSSNVYNWSLIKDVGSWPFLPLCYQSLFVLR